MSDNWDCYNLGTGQDAEDYINSPSPGFLGNLLGVAPSVMRQFAYRGPEQFLRDYRSIHDETTPGDQAKHFLVSGVTKPIFNRDFRVFDEKDNPFCQWCAYDADLDLLLFEMGETTAHSVAGASFIPILLRAVSPMKLDTQVLPLGTGGYKNLKGSSKESDMAFWPKRAPTYINAGWPGVVIETAYSETPKKLQADIRWWLHKSEGHVKTVIAILIAKNAPRLKFEKWEVAANGRIQAAQHINVSLNKSVDRVTVVGGPLTINFAHVFLRQPSIPREQDIEIGDDELESLARDVWAEENRPTR
ncbi:hypothetical protein BJX64DRAFT_291149 [Aspergillus heterothallicus]